MCRAFSCIVLEDVRVLCDLSIDSHEDIISIHHLRDDSVEALCRVEIAEMAKQCCDEFIEKQRDKIAAAIRREMMKPSRVKSMAYAIAEASEKSLQCKWAFTADIHFKEDR